MIELAIAFVVDFGDRRPADDAAAREPIADVTLDSPVLDRIDEIVRPGMNLNPPTGAAAGASSPPDCAG